VIGVKQKLFSEKAFSLIELLIVIAIVGILLAIALPSYQKHVLKARRLQVFGALLTASHALERHRVNFYNYDGARAGVTFLSRVPADKSEPQTYRLTLELNDGEYRIVANSVFDQAKQLNSERLTIDSLGVKTWTVDGQTRRCWPMTLKSC